MGVTHDASANLSTSFSTTLGSLAAKTTTTTDVNLSTNFATYIGDFSVSTFDTTRVTQSNFRFPEVVFPDSGVDNYFPPWHSNPSDRKRGIAYLRNGDIVEHPTLTNSLYEAGAPAYGPIFNQVNGSNTLASKNLFFQFDFLEVDHFATNITIDVELKIKSELRGFDKVAPQGSPDTTIGTGTYGNGEHNGRVRAVFHHDGDNDFSGATTTNYQAINDNTETTLTFTLTPSDESIPEGLNSQTNPTPRYPLGNEPIIGLEFLGVVTRQGQNEILDTDKGTQAGQYGGIFGNGMQMEIISVKARINYTGRTYLKTGYHPPEGKGNLINSDFGFSNLIPSNTTYKHSSLLLRSGKGTNFYNITFKNNTDTNLLSTSGDSPLLSGTPNAPEAPPDSGNSQVSTAGTEIQVLAGAYGDFIDHGVINEVVPAMSMFKDSNFNVRAFDGAGDFDLLSRRMNIAYMPDFTGGTNMSAGFTTTIQGNLIHNTLDSELNDIASSFSMSTFGGFLLKDPQPEISAEFTFTPTANNTVATGATPSTAFTLTPTANIIRAPLLLNISTAFATTVDGTVLIDTLLAGPTSASASFGFTPTANNTIGVTSINRAEPSAALAIASLSEVDGDIDIIRRPSDARRLKLITQTRQLAAVEFDRTFTTSAFTRTHTMPAHNRTITAPQFTRTIDARDL